MDQGVGREVKRLREKRGWSRTKLAAAADMSASGVSMIESGQRNLTTTTLAKLAEALDVGVAELFPKAEEPLPFEELEQRALNQASVPGKTLRPATLAWLEARGLRYTAMPNEEFHEMSAPGGVGVPPSRLAELIKEIVREVEELGTILKETEPPPGALHAFDRARSRWFVLSLQMQVQATQAASRLQAG